MLVKSINFLNAYFSKALCICMLPRLMLTSIVTKVLLSKFTMRKQRLIETK